ncbi:putative metal-dependent phosphoesterase TrpH [Leucobacter exalbidus]|uniref:Metal-dependent phosphoesterase TrpH n=1 Tax=Leucobacter exalbidus TaxID=662960 RepID=A0A940PV76_9MICO|nr:PHP domain-containing protein [Leucobacter exalbidus]MBP1324806.1 putative metal-dependent phosphoesterase TrpH [Leucobacter exalbidus]
MATSLIGPGFDLHTHSVCSDGTTTPAEIAVEAAEVGLQGFALTDHDTIDGWDEARAAAERVGVSFLPGIEITTKHNDRSRHLLGYGITPGHGELFAALARVREARLERVREMVRRVSADFAITLDDVVGEGDARTVGRPHIADALVAKGYFADRSVVFAEVLHPGSPYYLGTLAINTLEAISLVRSAGGVAVLAHPAAFRQRAAISVADVTELAAHGMWGIELEHPENREDWLPPLRAAAHDLGLQVTGSSDYHGAGKPNKLGEKRSPAALVEQIRQLVSNPH